MANQKHKDYSDILLKCAGIAKDRQAQYGMTGFSMGLTSEILDLVFGIKLTKSELAKVLIAFKFAREKFDHKEDNILDAVNYLCISLNERCDDDDKKEKVKKFLRKEKLKK